MTVKRNPDGSWEFESIADAAEWHRLVDGTRTETPATARRPGLSHRKQSTKNAGVSATNGDQGFGLTSETKPETKAQLFIRGLNPNGRNLIAALVEAHPARLGTEALAKASGVEATTFGPIFRHIYRAAQRVGLAQDQVVVHEDAIHEGRVQSTYGVSEMIATAWGETKEKRRQHA